MDTAIIGGGVVGGSVAYHLAQNGADVTVFEQDPSPCHRTTAKAAGGFRHQFSSPAHVRYSRYSREFFTDFQEETKTDIRFQQNGYLFLVTADETLALFRERVDMQREHDVPVEELDAAAIRDRFPKLDVDGVRAGFYCGEDGTFDPSRICDTYLSAATDRGATVETGVKVTDITVDGDAVRGVSTENGRRRFDAVVNAAGPWCTTIAAMVDVTLPVEPKQRRVAHVSGDDPFPDDYPLVSDFDNDFYMRPWEGDALIGGNHPVPDTAKDPARFAPRHSDDWYRTTLNDAGRRMDWFDAAEEVEQWSGLYSMTPDRKGIVDQVGPDGFYVACGFSGHGVMHSPATGTILAEKILSGEATTLDAEPVRYDRFELYDI